MPAITAVLHTHNDALRLGRALETLCPCDDIVIIDHGSNDDTLRVGREYGARIVSASIVSASKELDETRFIHGVADGWILCLDPRESLTEGLAAALFEWKLSPAPHSQSCFAVFQREETSAGWIQNPMPQTRLVPAGWNQWEGRLPASPSSVLSLDGELLRFAFP